MNGWPLRTGTLPSAWPSRIARYRQLEGGGSGALEQEGGGLWWGEREREGGNLTSYHQQEPYQHSEKVERNLSAGWLPSSRLTTLLTQ